MAGAYRDADATVSARNAVAVTPGSTVIPCTRALYVGAAGDVAVEMVDGGTVTFAGVPAGTVLPVQVVKVTAAASGSVLALY